MPVMTSILYLGIEGVLLSRHSCHRLSRFEMEGAALFDRLPLMEPLDSLVQELSEVSIVLNSWLVQDFGYRRLVQTLAPGIAARTIGATTPGNRIHRHICYQPRKELLRSDVKRRNPDRLTILDASLQAIPFEYLSRSVVTSEQDIAAVPKLIARLLELLTSPELED